MRLLIFFQDLILILSRTYLHTDLDKENCPRHIGSFASYQLICLRGHLGQAAFMSYGIQEPRRNYYYCFWLFVMNEASFFLVIVIIQIELYPITVSIMIYRLLQE